MSKHQDFRDFVLSHEFDQFAKDDEGRAIFHLWQDEYEALQAAMGATDASEASQFVELEDPYLYACETIDDGIHALVNTLGISMEYFDGEGAQAYETSEGLKRIASMLEPLGLKYDPEEGEISVPSPSEADAFPDCDTCGKSMDYMPWHYSKGDERHLHACDECWQDARAHENWKPEITNEMKIECIGEFSWQEEAPYYNEDGEIIEYTATHVVPWDICKDIYKRMASLAPRPEGANSSAASSQPLE